MEDFFRYMYRVVYKQKSRNRFLWILKIREFYSHENFATTLSKKKH